jgi:hypothetical protein
VHPVFVYLMEIAPDFVFRVGELRLKLFTEVLMGGEMSSAGDGVPSDRDVGGS